MFSRGVPPDLSAGRELSLYVVGVAHANEDGSNRAFEVKMCNPGDPVELRREPKNKHDPQAVAVFSVRGCQIGYLSADRAGWIGGRLAQGQPIAAIFQEGGDTRAVIRLNLAGDPPTLPPPKPRQREEEPPEDRFYADDDAPDWGC